MAKQLMAEGLGEAAVLAALEQVKDAPQHVEADSILHPLAQAVLAAMPPEPKPGDIRPVPMEAPIWGEALIDPRAIEQLQNAMRLPVTLGGALMPDAHVGYGIPIGGVVALGNAVAPYMVGMDIACRLMMSIYPKHSDVMLTNASKKDKVAKVMHEETRFGVGASFGKYERRAHAVLDDPDWEATKMLKHLKDKAYAQLGTSGSGNHFVDAGVLEVDAQGGGVLGLKPGTYLAIMTHSGSRGVGAQLATKYSKLAQRHTPLPDTLRHLAWLDLDSEMGQEYWVSM
ncbi:MAG: RtcB family protein, partial [Bacteroidota bacterium]